MRQLNAACGIFSILQKFDSQEREDPHAAGKAETATGFRRGGEQGIAARRK